MSPQVMKSLIGERLVFLVHDAEYSIPILEVQEIRPLERLTRLPGQQAAVLGVFDLRGTVVPVIDLGRKLGGDPIQATSRSVVIICRRSKGLIGLFATAVEDVVDVQSSDVADASVLAGLPKAPPAIANFENRRVQLVSVDWVLEERPVVDGQLALTA